MSSNQLRTCLAAALLLTAGCTGMLLHRSSEDYFPLVDGSEWRYLLGADTTYYQILGDTSVGGRQATVLAIDFLPEFWYRQRIQVDRFYYNSIDLSGQEYVLERRYGMVYRLPLVVGSRWDDVFSDTVVVLGTDTIHYRHRRSARVAEVMDLTTPAGSFFDCYRIEFADSVASLDTTFTSWTEWLAPGVGLVRREDAAGDQVLAWYRIGPVPE